jgi:uncharacterized protein YggU (UPF0235/DUF167 family)
MSARAIWYVAATKKTPKNTLYMHCNVKPGASKNREGITSINDEAVEVCVAAQAREGEANKAVIKVLSKVRIVLHPQDLLFCLYLTIIFVLLQVLDLPKSDLQITHGLKSRSKTVAAVGGWVNAGEEECLKRVREYLDRAVEGS